MNTPLNPEEANQFGQALGQRVGEFLDGYALVGFHAITQEPVIISHNGHSPKTALAVTDLLRLAYAQRAVLLPQPPSDNGAPKQHES